MSYIDAPRVGCLPAGAGNRITDVPGVTVGHATLAAGDVQTGVTVIRPHQGDEFMCKVPAAVEIINGFGKSVGLAQIGELGVLETPIALTNTFSVGEIATAQIRQLIARHPQVGRQWPTCNPLVFECNDGYLNDIQAFAVSEDDYRAAYQSAAPAFEQGSVGAGRGMSSFSMKGGIGSASRLVASVSQDYTLGALVLANFGRLPNLTVSGCPVGRLIVKENRLGDNTISIQDPEKGSIIMVLATNAPLDARQLQRLAKRAGAGLARTGSVYGHGSGDFALAFTTAYHVPALAHESRPTPALLHDTLLDPLFEAAAEATEQAIVNALWSATGVTGRSGHQRFAISQVLPEWRDLFERKM